MDIVEKLRSERVYVYTKVNVEPTDLMKEAANDITRLRKLHSETHYKMLLYEAERDKLREQLAATQAECIALQNRMDEKSPHGGRSGWRRRISWRKLT